MKRFKKRTLALVLASVVSVVGAFGSNNYKNSLMDLSFEGTVGDNVNLVVQTRMAYSGNVTPIRRDANTYVLMLPEMDSKAPTPDLSKVSSCISSINIRTMPYSNSASGYTRITIKTHNPSMSIQGKNQVYIPSQEKKLIPSESRQEIPQNNYTPTVNQQRRTNNYNNQYTQRTNNYNTVRRPNTTNNINRTTKATKTSRNQVQQPTKSVNHDIETANKTETSSNNDKEMKSYSTETLYLFLLALLIVFFSMFCYTKAKNKMHELAGEKLDISLEKDTLSKPKQKINKIKNTIKTLDNAYAKTALKATNVSIPLKSEEEKENIEIVDLDKLFQEQQVANKEQEENDALEDFLSGFSFNEEFEEEIAEETEVLPEENIAFDEEIYETIINNSNLSFTEDDLNCIEQLLDLEIQPETMRDINSYLVSCPIEKIPDKKDILENLLMDYAISRNIMFSNGDVDILYKLINVEIDNDFVTDLKTNPIKTQEMEESIKSFTKESKKPSEIVTLSVSDMLPNLSEALKLQGNKKIESNKQPEVIYYSEGYEVSTISLKDSLPDLSVEINKKESYISKPSAEYEYVDTTYVVGDSEIKASSELPDLQDVLAHPEKYEPQEEEDVVIDAEALLRNITNVTFKPFYDGTNKFEILNDDILNEKEAETPEYIDVFLADEKSIENMNIEKEEDIKPLKNNKDKDESVVEIELNEKDVVIENELIPEKEENISETPVLETTKCILDGETYSIIDSAKITNTKGVYLAKNNDNYIVLGYIKENLFKIKQYESLKGNSIHIKLSEKNPDGSIYYIVRAGKNKFVINVKDDSLEYVMDL